MNANSSPISHTIVTPPPPPPHPPVATALLEGVGFHSIISQDGKSGDMHNEFIAK